MSNFDWSTEFLYGPQDGRRDRMTFSHGLPLQEIRFPAHTQVPPTITASFDDGPEPSAIAVDVYRLVHKWLISNRALYVYDRREARAINQRRRT